MPCSLTLNAFDLDHSSSGDMGCQTMLMSAELHADIACSCLRSSVEAAAAHSEAAEEQLRQHQQLASAMVFQVSDTAKRWKDAGVRRLQSCLSQHGHGATGRSGLQSAVSWQLCRGRVCKGCK